MRIQISSYSETEKKSVLYKGILYFSEKEFTIAPNCNVDEFHKDNIKQKIEDLVYVRFS